MPAVLGANPLMSTLVLLFAVVGVPFFVVDGRYITCAGGMATVDMMLHLIEEHELNVMDIPIAFVAKKYVEYITLMEELNIDIASEYLVMAATLVHIKSRMLLPARKSDDGSEPEDPRAELVRHHVHGADPLVRALAVAAASVVAQGISSARCM